MGWTFHVLGFGGYLAVALVMSLVNGVVNSRDGLLTFREAFGISAMAWGPGMALFYAGMAVLLESGVLS